MQLSQRLDQIYSTSEEEQERLANSNAARDELLTLYLDEPGTDEDFRRISELFWWDEARAIEQVEIFKMERESASGDNGNGKSSSEVIGSFTWEDFQNKYPYYHDCAEMLRAAFLLPEADRKGNVSLKESLFTGLMNTPVTERNLPLADIASIRGITFEDCRAEFLKWEQQEKAKRKAAKYKPSSVKKSEPEPQQSEEILPLETEKVSELLERQIEPVRWIVPGLLPEGLAILAAPSKSGKSILSMNLGTAIATGERFLNEFPCELGDVLMGALEDSNARLQGRFKKERDGIPAISLVRIEKTLRMNFITAGGLEQLRLWLDGHPEAKLIIIDTMARVKPGKKGNEDAYLADTQFLAPLQSLAMEKHISILIVHHTRKAQADDPLERVHGSTALVGVADAVWLLKRRSRHDLNATLEVHGRDMEGRELALTLDGERLRWEYKGPAQEVQLTGERQAIVSLLTKNAETIFSTCSIAKALDKRTPAVSYLLSKLVQDGIVLSSGFGKYYIPKEITK